jgi:EmrB/QacA subfamily drug resistance transporter
MTRSTITLAVLCLAQFMLVLDAAVVAVAVPAIQADLTLTPGQVQAIGTAYALTFAGLLILAGRAADVVGSRRAFLLGLTLFTAASALCAAAPSAGVLVAARALQGMGAAVASPAALALLLLAFDDETGRTRAFAAWGAVAAGGAVAGQIIGGVLAEALGWRWIFLVNLPVGAAVVAAALAMLTAPAPAAPGARLDLSGAGLLTGGLVLLVLAATQATERGADAVVGMVAGAGLLALAAFLLHERRVADPLVRPALLARPPVRRGNAIAFLAAGASTTVVFLTALYLQRAVGLSTLEVGLGFAPVTAAIVFVSAASARLSERIGLGPTLAIGQLLVAAGALALSFVSADGSYLSDALPGLALVGIGSGLSYGPAMSAATAGVGAEEHGVASGVVSTTQQMGGALGFAVLASVAFGGHGGDPAVLSDAGALSDGFRATVVLALVAVLIALRLPRRAPASPLPRLGSAEPNAATLRSPSRISEGCRSG